MKSGVTLKSYINFFQSQLIKVSNCGEEVSALAFISDCMSLITCTSISWITVSPRSVRLSRAQSYI